MYLSKLLKEERIIKSAIKSINKDIHFLKRERDGEVIDPLIKKLMDYKNLDSAEAALAEAMIELKEVHNKMRDILKVKYGNY